MPVLKIQTADISSAATVIKYLPYDVDLRNATKAFELQKEAYDAGTMWAARNIGNYYELGIGVGRDMEKAAEIYRIA